MRRRPLLAALGSVLALGPGLDRPAWAHAEEGPLDPAPWVPDLGVQDERGEARRLRTWMRGQVSVVQLMFTGCSSVCPIQGALFAELQQRLPALGLRRPVRLLSISVDPLGDSPAALLQWLQRLQARAPGWSAAVPRLADLELLRRHLLGGPSVGAPLEAHSNRVFLFDVDARLRWRSAELPAWPELEGPLRRLAG